MTVALLRTEARAALRTRLEAMPGALPRAQMAYEGFSFSPTARKPFIEDELVTLHSTPRAIGAIEHGFSYNLTLKYPSDEGTAAIEAMAGKLLDWFKVGTKLTSGSTTVLCERAEPRGGIRPEADWSTMMIVVRLWACTTE